MKYLGNRSLAAALMASALFTIGACTKIDDRLGAGLVPKNQQMQIMINTPSGDGVMTLLYKRDSIPSSRTGYAWLGQTTDAVFGRRTASAVLQFLPSSWGYDYHGYGLDPIVDSAVIFTALSAVKGDTTQVQRFDVWDIAGTQEALRRDTTYYANFPIDKYKGRKLFSFSHKGRRNVVSRLMPTAEGKKYLDSIVHIKWDDYLSDSLFHLKFQGLYITPAEDSPAAAAIYGNSLASSGLMLYVRNHDTIDRTAIYDTMVTAFSFRDTDQASSSAYYDDGVSWPNVSVNMSAFDYTGSTLGGLQAQTKNFTDTLATSTPLSKVYVQSGGGVGTYIRFTDEMIAELRDLRTSVGVDGKDLAINRAALRIWLDTAPGEATPSTEAMDASISRLGSYLLPQSLGGIPDYQYVYEAYLQQTTSSYTLPYGGYLNRSNGYYDLDVTSYVQQLMKIKEGDPSYMYTHPAFYLAPDAYNIFGTGQTILKGTGSDHPVSVMVTYTIIEG